MLNSYRKDPSQGVANLYENEQPDDLKAPCLMGVFGTRGTGKSYLVSKYLIGSQDRRLPLYDRCFIITPSFNSNRAYWEPWISEADARPPSDTALGDVILEVEIERDLWELHQEAMKEYKKIVNALKNDVALSEEELMVAFRNGWLDANEWVNRAPPAPPVWHHHREGYEDRPAQCLLIIDDCLGQPQMLASNNLIRLATLNRHIAPLKEPFVSKNGNIRTSIALSVIFLSQSYRMNLGPSRVLRENLTAAVVFRNKQPKQMQAITEELGSAVEAERFLDAYDIATKEQYGSVLVDFNPLRPELQFRKGLTEIIDIPPAAPVPSRTLLKAAR